MSNYSPEEKPFNMSQIYLMNISEVRKLMTEQRVLKNYEAWYRLCCDLWDYCAVIFDDNENGNIRHLLDIIKRWLSTPPSPVAAKISELKIPVVDDKLGDVTQLLMIYLNNHERIFTKSKFNNWEQEIEADY